MNLRVLRSLLLTQTMGLAIVLVTGDAPLCAIMHSNVLCWLNRARVIAAKQAGDLVGDAPQSDTSNKLSSAARSRHTRSRPTEPNSCTPWVCAGDASQNSDNAASWPRSACPDESNPPAAWGHGRLFFLDDTSSWTSDFPWFHIFLDFTFSAQIHMDLSK